MKHRGLPARLADHRCVLRTDVHQVVIAPVGEHSEKPDEVYRRIERLYRGPYLELFARKEREGWKTWGNELPPPVVDAAAPVALNRAAPVAVANSDDGIPNFLRRAAPSKRILRASKPTKRENTCVNIFAAMVASC